MPISYSGIVNYGKAVLPSVESWGSNNNILRDPPRSITTRRVDKVTDSSMVDVEIDKSSERVAESIRVYPRGSNVMVGVSYNNQGMQRGGQQAKLPYRVMRDGVFRPPVLRPVNLLPLSRLPRNNTTVDPIAYTTDFSKKIVCPGTAKDYRSVKNELLQVETTAAKGQPIRVPVEVGVGQNIVQDRIYADAETQKTQRVERPVEVGVRQTIQTPLTAEAYSNIKYFDYAQHAQTVKYTNDSVHASRLQYTSQTNPSQKRHVQQDSKVAFHVNPRVQAQAQSNLKARGSKQTRHEHQEVRMKEVLRGQVQVNAGGAGLFNRQTVRPTATQFYLPNKPQLGGHASNPMIPSVERNQVLPKLKGHTFNHLMKKSNA